MKLLRTALLAVTVCLISFGAFAAGTVKFTDMAKRTVEIPAKVTKVFSTNPIGTLYVYAVAPEKVAGLNWPVTPMEAKYTTKEYQALPMLGGNFGGKKITLNFEQIVKVHPDFILFIGDINSFSIDSVNKMQEKLGIPCVMLDGDIKKTVDVIKIVGKLTNSDKSAAKLAGYVSKNLGAVSKAVSKIPADKKVKVYYAEGVKGLETDPAGSIHAEIIDMAGGYNVAKVQEQVGFGRTPVSMEQVLGWNPDVIIVCSDQGFATDRFFTTIYKDALWSNLAAVKAKNVYETPFAPFNWMDRPPSVNRVLGVMWMANLLYPKQYKIDIKAKTKEFYALFYHRKLTDAEVKEILATSLR